MVMMIMVMTVDQSMMMMKGSGNIQGDPAVLVGVFGGVTDIVLSSVLGPSSSSSGFSTCLVCLEMVLCQAQFSSSSSSVQFELSLSLKPGYYQPHPIPTTHLPGKVDIQPFLDYLGN